MLSTRFSNCLKLPILVCKFTELPCFHCPAYVPTPDNLPVLETYEQQILERLEIGRQANNAYCPGSVSPRPKPEPQALCERAVLPLP